MWLPLICRKLKGLLNVLSERIKHVYGMNLLGTTKKNQFSFKLLKIQLRLILPSYSQYLKYQLLTFYL